MSLEFETVDARVLKAFPPKSNETLEEYNRRLLKEVHGVDYDDEMRKLREARERA